MDNLLEHIDFGNEAGDDTEPEELNRYFIVQRLFKQFLSPRKKILVATGKKGIGKSALLQWTNYNLEQTDKDAIIVKARGADLTRSKFKLTDPLETPNDYIRDWMVRICGIVNRALAIQLDVALTDDEISLVECAEIEGYKSRNLVGCLIDRFSKLLGKLQPQKTKTCNEIELLKRANNRKLWILIDDLDATFQMTQSASLELSTFFSACRYLTQDLKDIHFRITMRTDVWSVIRLFDESLDKMEQYVDDIFWSQADFRKLLSKRIESELEVINPDQHRIYHNKDFFSEEEKEEHLIKEIFVPKMEWAKKNIHTYKVLYTLSYERPRWAIQLCKLAQDRAIQRQSQHINRSHINDIWGEYGKKRIADLVAEHKHQCSEIEELLHGFRGSERLLPRDQLFKTIKNRIANHIEPTIEGKSTRNPREIARFLFRIGFIIAKSESETGYEHYSFDQMPDFLSSRTDDDFGVSWEIHPCYREALDIKKLDRSHRAKFSNMRKNGRR